MGDSIAGVAGDVDGRNGVIIVLLINFTGCWALKYAASPPILEPISNFQFNVKSDL